MYLYQVDKVADHVSINQALLEQVPKNSTKTIRVPHEL